MNEGRASSVSTAMLLMALAFFAGFHFLPCFGTPEAGWTAWRDLWVLVENPGWFITEPVGTIGVFSFLAFAMLIAAAPFLGPVWRKSRIAWGIAATSSGLATFGFWGAVLSQNPEPPGSGGVFLLAATALNFLGLATARIRKPTPPARDNPVDDRQVDCRGEGGIRADGREWGRGDGILAGFPRDFAGFALPRGCRGLVSRPVFLSFSGGWSPGA